MGTVASPHGSSLESAVLNEPLLEVSHLCTGYGDLTAVWDVSLCVDPGSVTLLVGRNGVGKTTTLMAVAGLLPVFSGSIRYDGDEINDRSVLARVKSGVSYVPEGKRVFRGLSVEENLLVGGVVLSKRDRTVQLAQVYERFPLLAERRKQRAGGLSGGQQQVLALGQALMGRTRLLLLDEPSAGLAPKIFDDVMAAVRNLASEGVGVLLVEQVLDVVLPVVDRVTLLDSGRDVYTTDSPSGEETEHVVHQHLRGGADDGS